MSTDNPLVDPDSKISLRNYQQDPNDPAGNLLIEGYGKGKDEIGGVPLSGYLQGIPIVSDGSTIAQGLHDSAQSVVSAVEQGGWPNPAGLVEVLAGTVELGLDVGSFDVDPVAGVAQWAVLWLLQHFPPLRITLDGLAGNPDAITGYANTWNNIATRAGQVAADFGGTAKSGPGDWSGAASDRYYAMAQDTLTTLVAVATLAKALATLINGFGQVVAGARTIMANIIAITVSAILIDLPEAIVGDGGAVEAVLARSTKAVAQAIKLVKGITDLIGTLDEILPNIAALVAGIAGASQQWSGGVV